MRKRLTGGGLIRAPSGQSADVVMFVHREACYREREKPGPGSTPPSRLDGPQHAPESASGPVMGTEVQLRVPQNGKISILYQWFSWKKPK